MWNVPSGPVVAVTCTAAWTGGVASGDVADDTTTGTPGMEAPVYALVTLPERLCHATKWKYARPAAASRATIRYGNGDGNRRTCSRLWLE
jgi:hypothetical protein